MAHSHLRITSSNDGKLQAWDKEGKNIAGWPKDLSAENRIFVFQPRLVDIDFDLQKEIIAVSKAKDSNNFRLHIFKENGEEISRWRFDLPVYGLTDTPWLADVDHDSLLDIIVAAPDSVSVYRNDLHRIWYANFDGETSFVSVGDSDNNGLEDLFIVAGKRLLRFEPGQADPVVVPLPFEEKILGPATFVDIDGDNYDDIVVVTEGNRLAGIDRTGKLLLNVRPPDGGELASPAVAEDIDLDRSPELIVLTKRQEILAFETNGTLVARWKEPLLYRQPLPDADVVANDIYQGLFSSATGWDLYTIYRNKLGGYSHLLLGENVHDYDSKAEFQFVEAVAITDIFAFPKLFTPNGDGVNDTTQIHYRLSEDALITLDLYSAHGHFISHVLEKQSRAKGEHQETLSGIDTKGSTTTKDDTPLATGTYIVKVLAQSKDGFVTSSDTGIIINGVKAEIESPKAESAIYGKITVSGVAMDPNFGENNLDADFKSYKLYYRPGVWNVSAEEVASVGRQGSGWTPLPVPLRHQCPDNAQNEPNDAPFPNSNVSCRPVQHGELGTFDASNSALTQNGDYTLLLKVVDSAGNNPEKLSFDTRVVTIKNPITGDSTVVSTDLFDPRNPLNPLYQGPGLKNLTLSSSFVSREEPSTKINYTLENKTANIHIDIFPVIGGSVSSAVSSYSFNRQSPNAYAFAWNGTNTLGRNVDGGHYKIRITASAIDGKGQAVDESLGFDVARGFSSRDILAIDSFSATPDHINPFGFVGDLEPEKASIGFSLNKEAKVTVQIFSAKPEEGGVLQKTLLADQVRKSETILWDGSADNGLLLTAGRSYVLRLTATGIDLGNDERVIQDIAVSLEQPLFDANVTANLDSLKGTASEDIINDGELRSIAGNPDFLWRAKATGYVEVPFNYQISAYGTETYTIYSTNTVTQPIYQCGGGWETGNCTTCKDGYGGYPARNISVDVGGGYTVGSFDVSVTNAATHFSQRAGYNGTALPLEVVDSYPTHSVEPGVDMSANSSQSFTEPAFIDGTTVKFSYYSNDNSRDDRGHLNNCTWLGLSEACPMVCDYPNGGSVLRTTQYDNGDPRWVGCNNQLYRDNQTTGQGSGAFLYQCGDITVTAHGSATSTRPWPLNGQTSSSTSGDIFLNSLSLLPSANLVSYSASVGSGDVNASNIQTTGYTLALNNQINGRTASGSSNGSSIVLPSVAGWLDGGILHAETRDNAGNRITTFFTDRDDPYTTATPYQKIWGTHSRFNKMEFKHFTDRINIYGEGYRPNVFGNDPEQNLYTFSNAVHLTGWTIDVRYPNISVDKPDGDNALNTGTGALGIFEMEAPIVAAAGVRGFQNSNIEDNFRLKLLPDAQPKRFVEIWGSAPANYELYYYDAATASPKWVRIPVRTHNAVADNILAHWDVTRLNGKDYTLVLKSTDAATGKVNQDTFNIGIGTKVDTNNIDADAFVRVDSTFKRASLLFPKNALQQAELVTINPVPRNEADFTLPNGIAPIGPIFDIQPDGLQMDPARHVQLELTFSVEELQSLFNVADASEVQIYHLKGDDLLEGLVTIAQLDTHDDADPTNDVYRFTANLEHFSQYVLAKKQIGEFKITSPASDGYLKNQVTIAGRFEKEGELAPVETLTISYGETVIYSETQSEFNFQWDVSQLNGNFVLIFEARNAEGESTRYELPVAIDNAASQSILLVNGKAIADGGEITVGHDSVVEIKATDGIGGVERIEYAWNGETMGEYIQPLTLPFQSGRQIIAYRSVDKNGNEEALRQGIVEVEETLSRNVEGYGEIGFSMNGPTHIQNGQTWVTGETKFSLSVTGGAFQNPKYRAGNAQYLAYSNPFDLFGKGDGLYNIEFYAVNENGLRSNVESRQVILDTAPPKTEIFFEGDYQERGPAWIVSSETKVGLKSLDGGESPSGVSRLEFRWGSGEWAVYREPLAVQAPAVLSFRAVDRVGNVENENAIELVFDTGRPTAAIVGMPSVISPNGDGRFDTAEFFVLAADNFSKQLFVDFYLQSRTGHHHYDIWNKKPMDQEKWVWDGRVTTRQGTSELLVENIYTWFFIIYDEAGNRTKNYKGTLVYDLSPPQVQLTESQVLSFSPNGDTLADVLRVAYSVSDNLGSKGIKTELHVESAEGFMIRGSADNINLPPHAHQFSWDGTNLAENPAFDGTYRYKIIAEDPAGNRSEAAAGEVEEGMGQIFIDRQPPQTAVEITGPKFVKEEKTWLAASSQIRLNAVDPVPGAGVGGIQYAFGESALVNYTEPFLPPLEGIDYTLHYQSADAIGNREAVKNLSVRLDKTAPKTEINVGEPKIGEGEATWISSATPITLVSADTDGSGVQNIFIETSEVDQPLVYENPFGLTGLTDGLKHIYYWAKDNVDNEESKNFLNIHLDGTPPVTKIIVGDPKVQGEGFVYVSSSTPIDFETTAERNDLKKTEYQINEGGWKTAGPFQLSNEGDFSILFHATDTLDNVEADKNQKLVVDNTPPDPLMALNQGDGEKYITRQSLISLDGNATGAGVDLIEYKIDDDSWRVYKNPFGVAQLGGGLHVITWRSKDRLGNVSKEKKFTAQLIDVTITREDFALPRTLVYLLQSFDLRPEDPRLNADLLDDLLEEMGGYYKITDKLDDFIAAMRSDKFTTYILSTDSLVVNFADGDAKMIRTFKELKSRLDKGEALINLAGFAKIEGKSWEMFRQNWEGGDPDVLSTLGASAETQHAAKSFKYGNGHIVEIAANTGSLAVGENAVLVKAALGDLIEYVRPKSDVINVGEVIDSTLTFTNSGDESVVVSVKEVFPSGGFIETKATGKEVPVDVRSYDLSVPARASVSVDYLYRMPFETTLQSLKTEAASRWKTGIVDKVFMETPYNVERDLNALLASVSVPLGKVQASASKGLENSSVDLDSVLQAMDATSRTERETHLNLDETLESLQLSGAKESLKEFSSDEKNNKVDEPTSFHGPTASYVKGGCSLSMNAKPDHAIWFWMVLLISLPFVRGGLGWSRSGRFMLIVFLLISSAAHAADTGLMGINRQLYQVPADQTGVGTTVGTEIPNTLKPRVGVVTSVTKESVKVIVPATNRQFQILDWMWNADFLVSTGYWDHLSVGLAVPVYFYLNGTDFNSLNNFNAAAMGDLRLDIKYRIFKETEKTPALAFFSRLTMPTGSQAKWTGDRGVTWEYRVVAEKMLGRFQLFANAGMKIQKTVNVLSSEYGDAFTFGAAGRYPLPWGNKWSVEAELAGKAYLTNTQASSVPLELRINGRKEIDKNKSVYFGVG
ncbi:MAG: hypothetical protein Q7T03_00180, partial [Deltaproteobacteria bacterium]|nr:hypothetical protein [Deltaproteobacteria bacterium]